MVSGNVFEPRGLDELIPDWREDRSCPISATPVQKDRFYYFTPKHAIRLPTPPQMHNKGNYVISLSEMVRWLGQRAEEAGVEIYPGFAAAELLTSADGACTGVATGDMGIGKDGKRKDSFTPGLNLRAKATLLAEGCRGSLTKLALQRYGLREAAGADPQTYALGIKEVWQVDPAKHEPGTVWHSVGHPLPWNTYGGGFLYHMSDNRVSLGYVSSFEFRIRRCFFACASFKRTPMFSFWAVLIQNAFYVCPTLICLVYQYPPNKSYFLLQYGHRTRLQQPPHEPVPGVPAV